MKHVLRLGEEFITAHAGEIVVEAPREGAPPSNVFVLLDLACDLQLPSIAELCSEKLSAQRTAQSLSAMLSNEWVDGASPDAVRAALKALKLCRN
jgi:hypothetical protein